jgi:hypothetical protein
MMFEEVCLMIAKPFELYRFLCPQKKLHFFKDNKFFLPTQDKEKEPDGLSPGK